MATSASAVADGTAEYAPALLAFNLSWAEGEKSTRQPTARARGIVKPSQNLALRIFMRARAKTN
jgi:hypothetical protein